MKRQRDTFLTPLVVEVMPSGKRFKLHFDFTYLWKREYIEIRVRAGFVTDFASIPWLARVLLPKLGRYNKAAVIHDAIYEARVYTLLPYRFTRKEADVIFRDAMKELGVKPWQYNIMYWAVRIGGWMAWRKRE